MSKYRKCPVVIEAIQFDDQFIVNLQTSQLPDWIITAYEQESLLLVGTASDANDFRYELLIRTLEGNMRAVFGDFIIKGVQGEIYPCKPDIFEATYELILD